MIWTSMTGFGRGDAHGDEASVTAEIRSVNHRFLDIHARCPARYMAWEMRLRGMVREAVRRGKVDVFIAVREAGRAGTSLRVNRDLLASFLAEAERIRGETGLSAEVSFHDLLAVPDLFLFSSEGEDPAERLWPLASEAVRKALAMHAASRREEGERLRCVIRDAVLGLAGIVREIAALTAENKGLAVARFRERIGSLSGEAGVDPVRIGQEAALLVDRLDITEECDRLGVHVAALTDLLERPTDAVGKRFDFLLQEVFREINTAASKSAHVGISERAVAAKTELEKIREQIQNVE